MRRVHHRAAAQRSSVSCSLLLVVARTPAHLIPVEEHDRDLRDATKSVRALSKERPVQHDSSPCRTVRTSVKSKRHSESIKVTSQPHFSNSRSKLDQGWRYVRLPPES